MYPPVDTETLIATEDWRRDLTDAEQRQLDALPCTFLLGASRMVDYKRLDRVMQIGAEVKLPVVIAGTGPSHVALRSASAASGANVTFIIAPSDNMIRALYAHALAYVFPAVEDFGIMPVEAMACGTPVIANSVGGVRESVEAVGGGVICDIERWNDWDELLHQATSLDADAFRAAHARCSRAAASSPSCTTGSAAAPRRNPAPAPSPRAVSHGHRMRHSAREPLHLRIEAIPRRAPWVSHAASHPRYRRTCALHAQARSAEESAPGPVARHPARPDERSGTARSLFGRPVTQPSRYSTGPTPMKRHHSHPAIDHARHDDEPAHEVVVDQACSRCAPRSRGAPRAAGTG